MEPGVNKSFEANFKAEADLHCHILPAWDDGPRTLQDSLLLARKAQQLGVKKILATPHVGRSFGTAAEKAAEDIPAATAFLDRQIKDAGILLDLVPGAEVVLAEDLPARAVDQPWITVGGQGRYILVESPFSSWPEIAGQIIFELSLRGITAIIAHPERLADVQNDLSIAEALVQRGAVLQITARSLVGPERRSKVCARQMLKAGLVALVASDAHSERYIFPTEVGDELAGVVGAELARQILVDNANAVISGAALASALPVAPLVSQSNRARNKLIHWMRSRRGT